MSGHNKGEGVEDANGEWALIFRKGKVYIADCSVVSKPQLTHWARGKKTRSPAAKGSLRSDPPLTHKPQLKAGEQLHGRRWGFLLGGRLDAVSAFPPSFLESGGGRVF